MLKLLIRFADGHALVASSVTPILGGGLLVRLSVGESASLTEDAATIELVDDAELQRRYPGDDGWPMDDPTYGIIPHGYWTGHPIVLNIE